MSTGALDPLIHDPERLSVVATLAALPDGDALSVTRLQDMIRLPPGGLITCLQELGRAGYMRTGTTGDLDAVGMFIGRDDLFYQLEVAARLHADFGSWLRQQIESADAGLALAVIDLQRRTLGSVLGYALDHDLPDEAQAIAEPLSEYWRARGLDEEADAWADRACLAIEGPDGTSPPLDTPAGTLWLFFTSGQANRQLVRQHLGDAERTYRQHLAALQAQLPRGDRRPRRHRHRRHAVPGGQAAGRRRRAGLRRRSRPGSRHDLHRRGQPAVAGDLATGPGRSGRSKCGRAGQHRRIARRDLQLDVPARAEPHAGHQRTAAGLLDVPVPARARIIPVLGLIGAPLLITAVIATLFGSIGQYSSWAALAALPVAAWELSLGVWLVVKGFKPSPIATEMATASTPLAERGIAV